MKKYDIFVSYSRKDYWDEEHNVVPGNIVSQVVAVLEAYKQHYDFEYFFDTEEIRSSQEYLLRISDAIYESKAMLFLASENSYKSRFCTKEILYADRNEVKTHVYCIDSPPPTPPRKIELLLIDQQFFEISLCPIERMVQQVLEDVLGEEIKPLSELCANIPTNVKTYKVGDYYDDGVKQGVVFEVWDDGRHGKIVSLDHKNLDWCTLAQYNGREVVYANSEDDGRVNTNRVIARGYAGEFPAFIWCRNKGEGWYLPAIKELQTLLLDDAVHDAVNETLYQEGAIPLFNKGEMGGWYWSSSECDEICAWGIFMYGGNTLNFNKYSRFYVRAVSTF